MVKRFRGSIGRLTVKDDTLIHDDGQSWSGTKYAVAGAVAELDHGLTRRRVTASRVIAGSLLGPVGTVAGAMAKKDKSKIYVLIAFADAQQITVEFKVKQETAARKFVDLVNSASRHYAALEEKHGGTELPSRPTEA